MESDTRPGHLTDEELFGLAVPAAGEPEALPPHLRECVRCGRALRDWKEAVRRIGDEDVEPIMSRSEEEWRAIEDRTMERLRRAGTRRPWRALPWAVGLAASLLVAALLLTKQQTPAAPAASSANDSELSAQDAADDALLREVARLSRGEDDADWDGLAPEPSRAQRETL